MFEQVSIATGAQHSIDQLADGLVYYGATSLEASAGTLAMLCKQYGFEIVRDFIDAGDLRLQYSRHWYVVDADNGVIPNYQFSSISLAKTKDGRTIRHAADDIEVNLRRVLPGNRQIKWIARELTDRVIVRPHYPDIERLADADVRDPAYLNKALAAVLNEFVPGTVDPATFEVRLVDMGNRKFVLPMNVDFESANVEFHKTTPPSEATLSPAYLLANILTARQQLMLGAEFKGDIWIPPGAAAAIRTRLTDVVHKITNDSSDKRYFEELVFSGRSFGEALRSGTRTPADLLKFVQSDDTRQWKKWMSTRPADSRLVVEYVKESERKGLMKTVPARATKVAFFTGLGAAAEGGLGMLGAPGAVTAAVALGLNAADEFLASQLSLGWRPNTWVKSAQNFLDA